jgi:hypothetical protein
VALLLAGALGSAWLRTRDVDWNTRKPLWWLVHQAGGEAPGATAAHKELRRRLQTNRLSAAQCQRLIEHALKAQAQPAGGADAPDSIIAWCDLIDAMQAAGMLSQKQFARYARNAFACVFTVEARRKVRQGQPIPFHIFFDEPRVGRARTFIGGPGPEVLECVVERKTLLGPLDHGERLEIKTTGAGGGTLPSIDAGFLPGNHAIALDFDFAVFVVPTGQPSRRQMQGRQTAPPEEPLLRWSERRVASVEIVPPDQATVRLVANEGARAAVEAAIIPEFTTDQVEIQRTRFGGPNGMILIKPLPVSLSFDVFARIGDTEHQIGSVAARADAPRMTNAQRIHTHPREHFPGAASFDLILRASPEAAEQTLDIVEVWDGEIVIPDVPMRRP